MKQRVSVSVVIEPCSIEDDEEEYQAHAVATRPGVGYAQGAAKMFGYVPAGVEAARKALVALREKEGKDDDS